MKYSVKIYSGGYEIVNLTIIVDTVYEAVYYMENLICRLNENPSKDYRGFWRHYSGKIAQTY